MNYSHVIRALFDLSYETFEITGPQMVLVMKLTTFAWNVFDGRRPVEVCIYNVKASSTSNYGFRSWTSGRRKRELFNTQTCLRSSDTRETLLSLFTNSWLTLQGRFYFPGILVGPYLEFAEYMNLIDGTLFKPLEKIDEEKRASATIPGRLVPRGRKRVAYRKMVMGLVYLGLFVVLGGKYNFSIGVQDSFVQRSLLYRYVIHFKQFWSLFNTGFIGCSFIRYADSLNAPSTMQFGHSRRYANDQHVFVYTKIFLIRAPRY